MNSEILVVTNGQVYTKGEKKPLSVLTYPMSDMGGDYVRPDGGDWKDYPKHPLVNWAHRCPIGRGEVFIKGLKHPVENVVCRVAVGRTTFAESKADLDGLDLRRRDPRTERFWDEEPAFTVDECLETSEQARELIDGGVADGVSIEFNVDRTKQGVDFWDLDKKSLLDNHRNSRHFHNWKGLAYAHARKPVNPGCRTLTDDVADPLHKAIVVAETGRFNGHTLNPIILKAFDDVKELASTRRTSVTVPELVTKAKDAKGHGSNKKGESSKTTEVAAPKKSFAQVAYDSVKDTINGCSPHKITDIPASSESAQRSALADANAMHESYKHGKWESAKISAKSLADYHYREANLARKKGDTENADKHTAAEKRANELRKHFDTLDMDTRVHRRAMDTEEKPSSPEKSDGDSGNCPSHGCKALFNFSQGLMDLLNSFGNDIKMSDDRALRKYGKKLVAKVKDMAGDIKARGEKHKAKMDDENDDGKDVFEDDEEVSTEEKAIVVSDDGAIIIKAFPEWKPRRFRVSDLVSVTVAETSTDDVQVKALEARAAKVKAELTKAISDLSALADAAAANRV